MPRKLLWHSNAPFTPTGYGVQTGLFLPRLAKHYDVACSAFYGLQGAPIHWEGYPVFAGSGADFGNDTLPLHAQRYFGGDIRGGMVVALCDSWVIDPAMAEMMNMAIWTPVDHDPLPPAVGEFFLRSGAVPIAMSKFGEAQLSLVDSLYCPHGIDTQTYRPINRDRARGGSFPKDAFVVGMVAANKGRPSRKSFTQALTAFRQILEHHENSVFYLHTVLDANYAMGEDLNALIQAIGIPKDNLRIADQYAMAYNPYSTRNMAQIYSCLDVLLAPSAGEGFGVPILEAASCGVPSIVTNITAMPEVAGIDKNVGWAVDYTPYWSGQRSFQGTPDVGQIVSAMEECRSMKAAERAKMSRRARAHAKEYDVDRVMREFMLPALRVCEQRFDARKPVRLAARQLKVAA